MNTLNLIFKKTEDVMLWIHGGYREGEEYVDEWLCVGTWRVILAGLIIGFPFWYVVDSIIDRL